MDQPKLPDKLYFRIGEVAKIVGVPPATVKTRMFYARSKMADLLRDAGVSAV